jgi:hypothetical protein
MSDEITKNTLVEGENVQPVTTDTEADTVVSAKSDNVETPQQPSLEQRDGRYYVDGKRVYTRNETDNIAKSAAREYESRILQDLEVDDLGQIKQVVSQLRSATPENNSLDVEALKSAVQKREATVEELKAELASVRTDYALREHVGQLKDNMPTTWNADQKSAVIDLMKAREMLKIEGDTFAIKNGEDFYTVDGQTPDYKSAVEVVGRTLGLPFAKKGVDTFDADRTPVETKVKGPADLERMKQDPSYRAAYVQLRNVNKTMDRSKITDTMVVDYMNKRNNI